MIVTQTYQIERLKMIMTKDVDTARHMELTECRQVRLSRAIGDRGHRKLGLYYQVSYEA